MNKLLCFMFVNRAPQKQQKQRQKDHLKTRASPWLPWFFMTSTYFPLPIHFPMIPRWVGAMRAASFGWRSADFIPGFQQPEEPASGCLRRCENQGRFILESLELGHWSSQNAGSKLIRDREVIYRIYRFIDVLFPLVGWLVGWLVGRGACLPH